MLKDTTQILKSLSSEGVLGSAFAALTTSADEEAKARLATALNSSNGGNAEWSDCVGQEIVITGFDVVDTVFEVRTGERGFERAKEKYGVSYTEANGDSVVEVVERPTMYFVALCEGCRGSVSLTTLQSLAKNPKANFPEKASWPDLLLVSASCAGDFLARYGKSLVGKTLVIKGVTTAQRNGYDVNVVAFSVKKENKPATPAKPAK